MQFCSTPCAAYLECNYAHAQTVGMPSIEAFYDFTFLDQSEVCALLWYVTHFTSLLGLGAPCTKAFTFPDQV